MLEADLAISAAGQTLYELACTGCPTVAIKVASNQEGQLRAMESDGLIQAICVESTEDILINLKIKLVSLLSDGNARQTMVKAGQDMIDGKGGPRVAQKIYGLAH